MNKRIAFLVYNFSNSGGLNQVVVNLINELCNEYDIHLISLIQDKPISYKIDSRIQYTYLFSEEFRLRKMWKDAKKPLKEYVKNNSIEKVILEGDYPGIIGSSLRFTSKAKLVFHEHGSLMSQWERKDIVFIRFINSLLSHYTVLLTDRNKTAYNKRFLLKKSKIKVIENWVEAINSSVMYNKDSKKIIYAGRLGKEKGVLKLLKSWNIAREDLHGWSLDIYGTGEEQERVNEYIINNNLSSSVSMLGWNSNVREKFRDYAFFVLPSDREGFPLVLIEAQAEGLPVISFDVLTGPREILNHMVDGILVEDGNIDKLAEEIKNLANETDLRVKMSQAALQNVSRFSKENILRKWESLIEDVTI